VRLDALVSVAMCAQYLAKPSPTHMKTIVRIAQWLLNTPEKGLEYHPSNLDLPMYCCTQVDASFGGHTHHGRCHTGLITFTPCGIIHFKSLTQKSASTSASHSEAKGVYKAVQEVVVLRGMMRQIAIESKDRIDFADAAYLVLVDNKSAYDLALEPKQNEQSRHWFVCFQWLQQAQKLGWVRLAWIRGETIELC
jgi:hypothetical protein